MSEFDSLDDLQIVSLCMMAEPNTAKKATAEYLRRGHDILARSELAARLIELLDSPKGRPSRSKSQSLYRELELERTNPVHEGIRDDLAKALELGSTKREALAKLADKYRLSERQLERVCRGIRKPTKK